MLRMAQLQSYLPTIVFIILMVLVIIIAAILLSYTNKSKHESYCPSRKGDPVSRCCCAGGLTIPTRITAYGECIKFA